MKKFVFAVALAAVVVPLVALSAPASTGPTSQSKAATALVACGKVRTIGISEPITGPAASLGTQQQRWARFYATRYNATHKKKIRLVEGDSQLPNTAEAIKVAEQFASNGKMLGVVGPAGSQEVVASTPPLKNAGLAYVSGSATRTSLTDGSRKGYFFRTVPNDDHQGPPSGRDRRPGGVWPGALRHRRAASEERWSDRSAGIGRSGAHVRLLVARSPDPFECSGRLHALAATAEGAGVRAPAPQRGQKRDHVRIGRHVRARSLHDPGLVHVLLPGRPEEQLPEQVQANARRQAGVLRAADLRRRRRRHSRR